MSSYSGEYLGYEGSTANCNSLQQLRETVFDSTLDVLRYKDTSSGYWYFFPSGSSPIFNNEQLSGNFAIGTTPDSTKHLYVYNTTVNTTSDYYGAYFAHTKTAGTTNYSDDFGGIINYTELNHSGAEIGYLYGIYNYLTITDGTIGAIGNTRSAYNIYARLKQDGGTITDASNNLYAIMDLNAGTITGTSINLYSYVDHEDAHTLIGDLIGVRSYMARGSGLVGEAIGFQTYLYNVNDIHYDAVSAGIDWSANQLTAWGSLSDTPKDMSADSFWRIKVQSSTTGGAIIESFTDAAAGTAAACIYRGYCEDGPTANAVHTFRAYEHDGAGALTTLAAGDRILSVQNTTTQVFAVEADGKTMIGGTVAAQSLLHVYGGASGTTPLAGTLATVEDNDTAYLSILTPNNKIGGILFGDANDNDIGWIKYFHGGIVGDGEGMDFGVTTIRYLSMEIAASLQKYITINPGNADMDLVIGGNGSPAMTFNAGLTRFLMKDNLKLSFGDDDDGHIKYVSADNEHEVILKLPNSDPGVDYQLYYDNCGYVRINMPV